jgi:putative phosphoribosyl transferase
MTAQPVGNNFLLSRVLIDDGIATGATMLAAIRADKRGGAARTIVAPPIASHEAALRIREEADDTISMHTPQNLYAIGAWYDHYDQLDDAEVCSLLRDADTAMANVS